MARSRGGKALGGGWGGSPEQVFGSFWEIREGFLEEEAFSWDVRRQFCLGVEGRSFVVSRNALSS